MIRTLLFALIGLLQLFSVVNLPSAVAAENAKAKALPPIPLSLEEVLAWVDRSHPLLKGSGTEKIVARGRLLRALGAFEPTLVNDWELERLTQSGQTVNVGFNDSFLDVRHPSGIKAIGGWRVGLGPVEFSDMQVGGNQQPVLGIYLPLLRGLMVNPENAELQRSGLADPRADIQIAQTRQDLLLAAAVAALAACSTTSPDVISRNDAQRMSNVLDGVVLSTRAVTVDGSQSGVGAAAALPHIDWSAGGGQS